MSEKCLFYSVLVKTIFESLDTGCSGDRSQFKNFLIKNLNASNSTRFDVLTLYSPARMAVVVFTDDLTDGNLGSWGGGENLLADAGGGVIFPGVGV